MSTDRPDQAELATAADQVATETDHEIERHMTALGAGIDGAIQDVTIAICAIRHLDRLYVADYTEGAGPDIAHFLAEALRSLRAASAHHQLTAADLGV